jgi:mannose-6-phosphate isomerase-like protein (cupin superfamily)
MKGQGVVAVSALRGNSESAPIHEGDAIPIQLNDVHSFENSGSEPLELMVVGVSRDNTKRVDSIDARDLPSRRN